MGVPQAGDAPKQLTPMCFPPFPGEKSTQKALVQSLPLGHLWLVLTNMLGPLFGLSQGCTCWFWLRGKAQSCLSAPPWSQAAWKAGSSRCSPDCCRAGQCFLVVARGCMLGFSSTLYLSFGEQFSSDESFKLYLWCRCLQELAKKGVEEFVSSKRNCRFGSCCWRSSCGRGKGHARRAEDEAALGAWSRGKAAAAQLPPAPPLLLPSTPVPGSAAVVRALPAPLGAAAVRTDAVCDLSPSENNPWSALSPRIPARQEGNSGAKASSHAKGWVEQQLLSVCSSVRSSVGTGCMRRKEAIIRFVYRQSRILLFHSNYCAHIRA